MNSTTQLVASRFWCWLSNDDSLYTGLDDTQNGQIDGWRLSVFVLIHLGCLAVFLVGVSWFAVVFALFLYVMRMFFITAFYHRYFSHSTFRVGRFMQLLMAVAGCTAGQRGPLWWASHHREHHLKSDTACDPHSPKYGVLNSHTLWFLRKGRFATMKHRVRNLLKYPELIALERFHWIPFILLGLACYGLGEILNTRMPGLGTNGPQLLVWGFLVSTVFVYHATYTINSLCHRFGSQRFKTDDDSRNNFFLALLTLGEGWHNNHHRYPVSTRQGFYWWELDVSYYVLCLISRMGLISNMNPVPASIFQEAEMGACS